MFEYRKTLLAAAISGSFLLPIASTTHAETEVTPNVITIMIDDMGFSDLSFFGSEINTPNLESLSSTGTLLTNFYSASTSTPSRSIMFTGRDNHQVGVGNMAGFMRDEQRGKPGYEGILSLEEDVQNSFFPDLLTKNGYHTMMTGKWDMGDHDLAYFGQARGFSETDGLLLPGGDTHFMSNYLGEVITSHPPVTIANMAKNPDGSTRTTPYVKNGQEITTFPREAYSSTYYTDKAIELIDATPDDTPFYLNVAHIAPHFPLQAPESIYSKYLDTYAKGWDVLAAERFAKLKDLGYISQSAEQPARWAGVQAWDDLTADEQKTEAKKMAVYAAMIEIMDTEIGRLIQHLKDQGKYDDTMIIIASDNGGAFTLSGNPAARAYRATNFTGDEDYDDMGSSSSYIGYGRGWSMVNNTPYNQHKGTTFEGGIHTSAIISYPNRTGFIPASDCVFSMLDIAPTILEMTGTNIPATTQGISMAPLLKSSSHECEAREIGWELDGVKGLRSGDWKLSQQRNDEHFYLYDLSVDPFEQNDLSASEPEKLAEMMSAWKDYVNENGVIEVSTKKLKLLTTEGSADAVLTGGVVRAGAALYALTGEFTDADTVDVAAYIRPDPAHVGMKASTYAHLTHTSETDEVTYYALTESGLVSQSTADDLANYQAIDSLDTTHFMQVAKQAFAAGTLSLDFGYITEDGTKVSSTGGVTATLTKTPDSDTDSDTDTDTGSSSGGGSFGFLGLLLLPYMVLVRRFRKES